jgi:hypothetical protein
LGTAIRLAGPRNLWIAGYEWSKALDLIEFNPIEEKENAEKG